MLFAREGAIVFGCDIDAPRASATVSAAQRAGLRVESAQPIDLTNPPTCSEKRDRAAAGIPLGRIGTPEDIAYCALYLASGEAAWITVDGGITAR